MDEYELKRRIYGYVKEICHYSQMQVFATSYYQKNYFQMQIDDATSELISLYMDLWKPQEHRRRSHSYRYQENNIESYEQILQPDIQFVQENQSIPSSNRVPDMEESLPQQGQQETEQEQHEPGSEPSLDQEQKSFTVEELAYYDGTNGKPAYVSVNGIVYDVSAVVRWAGGRHFGLEAGRDLSAQFMGCHRGIMDRLNKLPKAGILA